MIWEDLEVSRGLALKSKVQSQASQKNGHQGAVITKYPHPLVHNHPSLVKNNTLICYKD